MKSHALALFCIGFLASCSDPSTAPVPVQAPAAAPVEEGAPATEPVAEDAPADAPLAVEPGTGSLTSDECTAIRDKEAEILGQMVTPGKYPQLDRMAIDGRERALANCLGGDGYNREDYECFVVASDLGQINACNEAAGDRRSGSE